MKTTFIAAAVMSVVSFAAPASAAIVKTIGDGQTFCESLDSSVFTQADCDLGGGSDLANDKSMDDKLTFLGEGRLAGFLADGNGVGNGDFPDYANITLTADSIITMMLVQPGNTFDASFSFGNLSSTVLDPMNLSVSFFASAGTYLFSLDATNPTDNATFVGSSYTLDVAAVPLPAGALFMLTGLGGLAAVRRKRTTKAN